MKQHLSPGLIGRIKGSVKNWLLPHPFKIVGQVMLLAILVALVIQILTTNVLANGDVTIDMLKVSIWQRAISIGLYLSMFLITCSREKAEDEMTAALRGETLKEIGYLVMLIYVAYRIVITAVAENIHYITHDEPFLTPFIVWVLYYACFERKMRNLRRQSREFKL